GRIDLKRRCCVRGGVRPAVDQRSPRRREEPGFGWAFRFKIAYNRCVQTAAVWSRSPPHRNHGYSIAIRRAVRGYRAGHSGAVAAPKLGRKPKLTHTSSVRRSADATLLPRTAEK